MYIMQARKIEFTPSFVIFMAVGFAALLVLICLTSLQIFKVVTSQISLPHYTNVSKIELVLISLILGYQALGAALAKFTSATSQDANPPAKSYLRTKIKVRIWGLIVCALVFVST